MKTTILLSGCTLDAVYGPFEFSSMQIFASICLNEIILQYADIYQSILRLGISHIVRSRSRFIYIKQCSQMCQSYQRARKKC